MKYARYLPPVALLLGCSCMYLRRNLYLKATDAAGLLESGTPLEWGIFGITALSLLVFAMFARKWQEAEGFPIPGFAALGQLAGGVGIGWVVLRFPAQMPGVLSLLWKAIGILAAAGLLWTAWRTLQKKAAVFPVQLFPCLFWLVHMLDNYRTWSSQPQLQSYVFELLGAMAATLLSYHIAAASIGVVKPRIPYFWAFAAAYFCSAAAIGTPNVQILYLLSGFWAMCSVYNPIQTPMEAEG